MRSRLALLLILALIPCGLAAGERQGESRLAERVSELASSRVSRHPDGRIAVAWDLAIPTSLIKTAEARAAAVVQDNQAALLPGGVTPADLRLVETSDSLTGSHVRLRQWIGEIEILGAELVLSFDDQGRLSSLTNSLVDLPVVADPVQKRGTAAGNLYPSFSGIESSRIVALAEAGTVRLVRRIVTRSHPLEPIAYDFDLQDGSIVRVEPLYFNDVTARVFEANPITTLNNGAFQDNDDAASAIPESAYQTVILRDLQPSGPLAGPNVRLLNLESPLTKAADVAAPLSFDRGQEEFEEVMVYYHLDQSQRHLQSLGYTGTKRVVRRAIQVDAHAASGADNSYYISSGAGEGNLYFGDGGVDDAEDPDIVLHEYGHAIQDSIAPGTFGGTYGSESRAMGEGFSDYWAFSHGYVASLASGRDAYCVGDWDARCGGGPSSGCAYPAGSDCLRRVDGRKTMDDYSSVEQRGTEHRNGEIWSSALRQLFEEIVGTHGVVEGRRIADRLILESHFGAPPQPKFRTMARRILETDRLLNLGANSPAICSAMTVRKIFNLADCDSRPRGELVLFQSEQMGTPIPDGLVGGITSVKLVDDPRSIERLQVSVDILHPHRGDLRLVLFAPDGRSIILQTSSSDSSDNLRVTYGFDAESAESLGLFRGMSAAGEWKLQVSDIVGRDTGILVSWSLLLKFMGEEPLLLRERSAAPRKHLAAVANVDGAEGTRFITDVRLFNRANAQAQVTAFFTPSGSDGSSDFAAINIRLSPGQIVALDDIVRSHFRTTGVGTVEFRGDVNDVVITSRTYNDAAVKGTYGQFIASVREQDAIRAGEAPLHIIQLQNTEGFRANVGVAELSGSGGEVEFLFRKEDGTLLAREVVGVAPFSHLQFPILGGRTGVIASQVRAEVRVTAGNAALVAYGSVIDNGTGDAIYLPANRLPRVNEGLSIPAAIHADGANGTKWRTDVWVFNGQESESSVGLTFYGAEGMVVPASLNLAAGELISLPNAVQTVFGLETATGQIAFSAGNLAQVLVTSRTWTETNEGTLGQFIAARTMSQSIGLGSVLDIIQMESSNQFRTNVGVAEVSGQDVEVRLRVFDAAGTEIFSTDRQLAPHGQFQMNLALAGAPPFVNGRVSLEVTAGSGTIHAYGSVIDNLSGDPIFVPGE